MIKNLFLFFLNTDNTDNTDDLYSVCESRHGCGREGVEQKSENICSVMSYMALHLESQTTHPLRGLKPADCHPTLDRITCL